MKSAFDELYVPASIVHFFVPTLQETISTDKASFFHFEVIRSMHENFAWDKCQEHILSSQLLDGYEVVGRGALVPTNGLPQTFKIDKMLPFHQIFDLKVTNMFHYTI